MKNSSSTVLLPILTNGDEWGPLKRKQQQESTPKMNADTRTPCRFYQLGQCSKGSKCTFMHKKAPHFTQTQCKFYTSGFCRNGDRCPFSHETKLKSATGPPHNETPKTNNSLDLNTSSETLTDIQDDLFSQVQFQGQNGDDLGFFMMEGYDITNQHFNERNQYSPEMLTRNTHTTEEEEVGLGRSGSLPQSPLLDNILSPGIWGAPVSSSGNMMRTSQSLPESVGNWGHDNSFFSFDRSTLVGSVSPRSSLSRTKTIFNTPLDKELEIDQSFIFPPSNLSPSGNVGNDKSLPISIPSHNKTMERNESEGLRYREGASSERSSLSQPSMFLAASTYPPGTQLHTVSALANSLAISIRDLVIGDNVSEEEGEQDNEPEGYDFDIEFDELLYTVQKDIFDIPELVGEKTDDGEEVDTKKKLNLIKSKKGSPETSKEKQLCPFYVEGNCRYGTTCRNVHGNICKHCKKPVLFPFDDEQNEKHIFECQEMRQLESELEQSKLFKCEICKNNVFESNNRFGLLTECSHCFCLQCIKDWRSETQKSECPVCNIVSHFVVPSNIMVTDKKRKNYIIQNYKEKMRQIPCKYFDGGKGTCKFGTNCHYSHIDESAPVSMDAPIPLNDYSTFESKNRIITDAQGEAVSVNAINLGMFLPEIIQKDFKSNKKHPEEKKTEERTKK